MFFSSYYVPGISRALFCLIFLRNLQGSDVTGQMRDWKLRKIKKYNKVTKAGVGRAGILSLGLLDPDHSVQGVSGNARCSPVFVPQGPAVH